MQQQISTCRHGVFECNGSYCYQCSSATQLKIEDQIQQLINLDKAQTVVYQGLLNRIKDLESKISEKYAHPNVIGRLERLEEILPRYDELHKEWMDRIDKLEKLYNVSTDIEKVLLNRVKKLERFQEVTHLEFHARNKKPYKCPVCNGDGRVKLDTPLKKDNATYFSMSCVPCNEKGILWG